MNLSPKQAREIIATNIRTKPEYDPQWDERLADAIEDSRLLIQRMQRMVQRIEQLTGEEVQAIRENISPGEVKRLRSQLNKIAAV